MNKQKEEALARIEKSKYMYIKTGLFEHLEEYFKECNEGYRVGLKPGEVPLINVIKKEVAE